MNNELQLIENELVPVYETSAGEKVVNGRELWTILKSKRQFANWVNERIKDCDAIENADFIRFNKKIKANNANMIEYIIKLDTAKEMAMLERNEIGKQVRRYFIKVEKKYKEQLVSTSSLDTHTLEAINEAAKIILTAVDAVGIEPIHKSYLVKQLYGKAGIEVPTLRIEQETLLYTRTMIAKELCVYSEGNRPHSSAIGAIMKKLIIEPNNMVLTSYNRQGHTGVDYQYKPPVVEQVKQWLEENSYPDFILDGERAYSINYKKVGALATIC